MAYIWEFGDGEAAQGISVTHSYTIAGTFEPSLTVVDADGNISTTRPGVVTITGEDTTSDTSPPQILATLKGILGQNGWYASDVAVTWSVEELESDVTSTEGCDPVTLDTDTAGFQLTCKATSAGGTAAESVTVKRDATAPNLTCPSPEPVFKQGAVGAQLTATASDQTSGVNASRVTAPIDTSVSGAGSVDVATKDRAGNETQAKCRFTVSAAPPSRSRR